MTSMIDVVFLLLTFFVMTLKIIEPEGDFGIRMPLLPAQASITPRIDEKTEPIRIRLISDAQGNLANIKIGDVLLGPETQALRARVIEMVGLSTTENRPHDLEAELDCDAQLHYQYTIDAITAISGYRSEGRIIPLIEKVRFADR